MGLWEDRLGHLCPLPVLVVMLRCVVEVVGVLSFWCGWLWGHFGPLGVVFVLVISFFPELFVATDIVALSFLRKREVL